MTQWALAIALGPLFVSSTDIDVHTVPIQPPYPGWDAVVRLLSSPKRAIDAETVERLLGVKLIRRMRAIDDYDAWLPGRNGKANASMILNYTPWQYKGHSGLHVTTLQIFLTDFECVSPTRMREDLLRAGFTTTASSESKGPFVYYTLGALRSIRVSYPIGSTGAAMQLWAVNHHTNAMDRRCVGDIYIDASD